MAAMFRGGQPNPYDDIVAKATDENLTSENWEVIITLCDKVQDEGEQGARNVIAAVLKRLTHRNANVQLYALALVESMSKNCGLELHREMASRAFTQGLEKIINDRTTHEKVKRRALSLIAMWASEFEKDPSLGIMEECYNNLKAKNYKFETPQEAPPPDIDDAVRRREEEELQRALEISVRDKGGRDQWAKYSAFGSSSNQSSSASAPAPAAVSAGPSAARSQSTYAPPPASSGYVPARTPSPKAASPVASSYAPPQASGPPASSYAPPQASGTPARSSTVPPPTSDAPIPIVTRVRALHTFEPTEAGELPFEKGDIIKVVDRGYKDWWRGQLKGRTGIFPVNYVEPMPEPNANQLAKEAEQEAAVFSQAANVDKLLTMLREFDSSKDNLADNEEIQELYRNSMGLRTKIVKLIDKYSQKRSDLVSMNETFVKARSIYERMMEQSLARLDAHDARPGFRPQYSSYGPPGAAPPAGPQGYGWNPAVYEQPGYNAYPAPAQAYPPGHEGTYPSIPQGQGNGPQHPGQPYGDQGAPQQPYAPPYGAQQPGPPQSGIPYGGPTPTPGHFGGPQPSTTPAPHAQQYPYGGPQPAPTPAPQGQPYAQPQAAQSQTHPQAQAHPQPQAQQPQPHAQFQAQPQPQQQPQPQPQPQTQQQPPQAGAPYVYDPNTTYADPNVQAWAQYFAQGGTDPTGAVYFISVPGVKEAAPDAGAPPPQPETHASQQAQPQAAGAHPGQQQPHDPNPLAGYAHQAPYGASSPPASLGQPSVYQPGKNPGSPGSTYNPAASSPPHTEPFAPQQQQQPQQQPTAAPGPYAPGPYAGAAGAVYPPAGYQGAPQSPHPTPGGEPPAPQWQGQYQGLPGQMGAMSLGQDGAPPAQPSAPGVGI